MFGNVRSRHKSAVIDAKLSPKRKLSFWGMHAPLARSSEFLDSPLAHSKTEA
jgi:hypothetical protein